MAFFVLTVLINEAVMLAIIPGSDQQTKMIISLGMVISLILLIGCVFYIMIKPPINTPEGMIIGPETLKFSGNDYRFIRQIDRRPNLPADFYSDCLRPSKEKLESRVKRLSDLGYIQLQHADIYTSELQLTSEGHKIANIVKVIEEAIK